MEEKIFQMARKIANANLSGKADLEWHKLCVDILESGLNADNLLEFEMSDGKHHNLEMLRQGDIYMMASYLRNFLDTDSFTISYCAEIQIYVADFVKNYQH